MRIPTLAVTLAAAAAVVALPTAANAVAPVPVNDSAQTETGTAKSFNVLTNDRAAAANTGRNLVVTATSDPANGTATCDTAGACTYTPDAGFSGTETFTYKVADSTNVNETNTGTVTVTTVKVGLISISSSPTNITYSYKDGALVGRKVTLTGIVRQANTVALPNVEVELWYRPFGQADFTKLDGPFLSGSNGSVSFTDIQRTSKTYYQWRSKTRNSGFKSVSVTPTLTTKFSPSRTQAVNQPFTVSGKSEPATAAAQVLLQRRSSTGAWVTDLTTTLTSDSTYAFPSITPTTSSSELYRVVVPAANGRQQVMSVQNTVKAYDAEIAKIEATNSDEFVTIRNSGNVPINLKGWQLSDSNSHPILPARIVAPDSIVKVHTGKGVNDSKNLYLRHDGFLWANSGTVKLHDNADPRVLLDSVPYGTPQ